MKLLLTAAVVWNVWLLILWTARFHILPGDIAAAWPANFPVEGFSPAVLAGNWWAYTVSGVCLAGMLGVARRLGRRAGVLLGIRYAAGGEGTVVRFGLGLGLIGCTVLGFGLVGLLYGPHRFVSVIVLASIAGLEAFRLRGSFRETVAGLTSGAFPHLSPATWIVVLIVAAVTGLGLLNVELGWDAFTYHLRLPAFYIYRHKIFDVWHHYCGTFPSLVEMLYTVALAISGENLVRFLNFVFGMGLLIIVRSFARRVAAPPGLAIVLFVASPAYLNLTTRAYVDLGFAFFCGIAVLSLLRWWATGSRSALVVSGLMAGSAMGSKYVGILVVAATAVAVLPRLRERTGRRSAVLWCCAALVPLLPWLVRNWVIRANPVFPFLSGLFGTPVALPAEFIPEIATSAPFTAFIASLPTRAEAIFFDFGAINGPLAPLVAGLLPLVFLFRFSSGAVLRRWVFAYAGCWFVLCPDSRFFLPVLPVFCALAAAVLRDVAAAGVGERRVWRLLVEAGLIVGLVYSAGIQWIFYAPASVPLGFDSVSSKLERVLPPSPFTSQLKDFVNANLPRRARIMYLCHFNTYHVERECLADFHFGEAIITGVIRRGRTSEGIRRELKRMGVDWLLSTGTGAAQYADIDGFFDVSEEGWRQFKILLCKYGEVSWQSDEYTLYHLGPRHLWRRLPALPVYEALVFREADRAFREGRFDEALARYLAPPPLLEEVGSTFVRQGDAFRAVGRFDRAVKAYEQALKLGVQSARLHQGIAEALLRRNKTGEALLHAQAAWGRNSRSAQTAAVLAGIYATAGNFEAGRMWVRRAIVLNPQLAAYREMATRIEARAGASAR